jgi:putative CocE/NonD family hydrolase
MTAARRALLCALSALILLPAAAHAASAAYSEFKYLPVADGTDIAVTVHYPQGFKDDPDRKWPALFGLDGYGGAKQPNDGTFMSSNKYVAVYASVRGTGCSGGKFDLFSWQSAQDGKYLIDDWIAKQPWSDGRVGIWGHSYAGLMGFLVAATSPEHLYGTAVSGLIDDFYRGILYPGGVPNSGFPIAWGAGVRPLVEAEGDGQAQLTDDACRTHFLEHQMGDYIPPPDLAIGSYAEMEAGEETWSIQHALIRRVDGITAPIQVGQQFQDEQTGPRGGHVLFGAIHGVPKRLVMSNGRHNPNDPTATKAAWLDCWVIDRGHGCGATTDPDQRVLIHFDTRKSTSGAQVRNTPYRTSDWPVPETDWQRYFLRTDGQLSNTDPGAIGAVAYATTATDQRVTLNMGDPAGAGMTEDKNTGAATEGGAPNQAVWTLPIKDTTALAGPIDLTLWARLSSVDTDFFVDLIDKAPDGTQFYLQRGLLRSSFREVDPARSERVASGPHRGEIYRPYHPFVNPTTVLPDVPIKYEIEVFPVAQVLRKGHQLVVRVHAPPLNDPLSTYSYPPEQAPGVVQILQDADHPSSILLPFLPTLPSFVASEPACGQVSGEVCFTPAADGPNGPALP